MANLGFFAGMFIVWGWCFGAFVGDFEIILRLVLGWLEIRFELLEFEIILRLVLLR